MTNEITYPALQTRTSSWRIWGWWRHLIWIWQTSYALTTYKSASAAEAGSEVLLSVSRCLYCFRRRLERSRRTVNSNPGKYWRPLTFARPAIRKKTCRTFLQPSCADAGSFVFSDRYHCHQLIYVTGYFIICHCHRLHFSCDDTYAMYNLNPLGTKSFSMKNNVLLYKMQGSNGLRPVTWLHDVRQFTGYKRCYVRAANTVTPLIISSSCNECDSKHWKGDAQWIWNTIIIQYNHNRMNFVLSHLS